MYHDFLFVYHMSSPAIKEYVLYSSLSAPVLLKDWKCTLGCSRTISFVYRGPNASALCYTIVD